ncbi:hypothetical protein ACTML9_05170 [Porphyromonas levii]|nr:hypothetical protein [Porphyromonas levii]TFH96819.1 hypothetical protein E4P48_03530 [Porphyromonas levii]
MKKFIIATAFIAVFALSSSAQTYVVDYTCIKQVGANGAAATAQESTITNETDKSKVEQNKVQKFVLLIERHLDMIEKAQKDITAFSKEGAAINLFAIKTKKATTALAALSKSLPKNVIGVVGSSNLIADLSLDIYGICNSMVATVVDAKFTLPEFGPIKPKPQMNLLEPQERLAFYQRCISSMDMITRKIMQMHYTIIYTNNINIAFKMIAPRTSYTIEYGKSIALDIINSWKK